LLLSSSIFDVEVLVEELRRVVVVVVVVVVAGVVLAVGDSPSCDASDRYDGQSMM
jgi:hypothetical protein